MIAVRLITVVLVGVLLITCGVASPPAASPPASPTEAAMPTPGRYPLTVTDGRGKEITIPAEPRRIVSIAPSATEIVFALGAGDLLVAVDDFSDHPAEAKELPKVAGFRASPEQIVAFEPDLVLTVTQAEVAPALEAQGLRVIVFDAVDIEGVYKDILLVGTVLGREREAEHVVAGMRSRIDAVAARTRDLPSKPRVLHELDATDPSRVFVAGANNFIDTMIRIAGGVNVGAAGVGQFPQLSAEEVVRADPQVIVLGDAKYGMTAESVKARPGWGAVEAVRTGRILPVDPDIVSRPGPRLADGVEAYARLLHPDLFR